MAEKPILFSAPMVRAIRAGTKAQTRRVVKPQPVGPIDPLVSFNHGRMEIAFGKENRDPSGVGPRWWRPAAQAGDTFWVREGHQRFDKGTCDQHVWYMAGGNEDSWSARQRPEIDPGAPWPRDAAGPAGGAVYSVPSIHMPRWASRILLSVTDVRVQRLHDISEGDAEAEGIREPSLGDLHVISPEFIGTLRREIAPPLVLWEFLWKRVNGDASWDANPWVFAYTFERVQP